MISARTPVILGFPSLTRGTIFVGFRHEFGTPCLGLLTKVKYDFFRNIICFRSLHYTWKTSVNES